VQGIQEQRMSWKCICGSENGPATRRCKDCGAGRPDWAGNDPAPVGTPIVRPIAPPAAIAPRPTGRPRPALSDLSATEFVTLARLGFFPHGLVVGACIYDAGWGSIFQFGTQELTSVTTAMRRARSLAVERMKAQAHYYGAEGVVGVRLQVEHHQWHGGGHNVARFLAVGTAIAFDPDRAPLEFKNSPDLRVDGHPFTSALSGQDFALLLRAGYRPVSVAFGNCVYHLATKIGLALSGNSEIADYTRAFMDARETAMQNLVRDLMNDVKNEAHRPVGIVGMTVEEIDHAGSKNIVEYTALGTAIAPVHPSDPRSAPKLPEPTVVVPVDV
jgi:uncharacterized protein YbjQ (UPF0145 family)